jgi:hypothetical protein
VNRRKNASNFGNPGRFAKEIDAKYRVSTAKEEQNKKGCSFEQPFYFRFGIP